MPWSGASGSQTYSRTDGTRTGATVWQQAKAASVKIVADGHDTHDQDIATALNAVLKKDGGNTATANIPMGGFLLTGLGTATSAGQSLAWGRSAEVTTFKATGAVTAASTIYVASAATFNSAASVTGTLTASGPLVASATSTHQKGLLINETATAISTGANQGLVFVKNDGTQTELYFREESNGDEVKLTSGGAVAAGGAPTITVYATAGGSGTHTLASSTRWIKVRMVAPGGGGGGASGAGSNGGNSTFGSVTAIGGSGGGTGNAFGGAGGTGGTGTLGTTIRFDGERGDGNTNAASGLPGARGGGTALFGGGGAASAGAGNNGLAGATNSGGGGGGASVSGGVGGAGGGAGESVEITIGSPAASYSYAVGAGGSGGSGGTTGGAGAAGRVIIEEYA